MNIIKPIILSVLLLAIPVITQGQEVKISMEYCNQSNLLIINIVNNIDKEVIIMNQSSLNELSGSRVIIRCKINEKQSDVIIPLFDTEKGKRIPVKVLPQKGILSVPYYLDTMGFNNPIKIQVQLVAFIKDEKTNKQITKEYSSELYIK